MNFRLILSGLALQFALAVFLLCTPPGKAIFAVASKAISVLVDFSDTGSRFLFGSLVESDAIAFS